MPAQALIRKLSRSEVDAAITKLNASDLLECVTQGDACLVRCKPLEGGSVAGAPEALQVICDLDAKRVRDEEKAAAAAANG